MISRDVKLAEALEDRSSFRRFCGFSRFEPTPTDHDDRGSAPHGPSPRPAVVPGVMNVGRQRQSVVFLAGLVGRRARVPFDPRALERAALRRMSRRAAANVAGVEGTMDANAAALARHRILQRMLHDVSHRDLSVELFGRRLPLPILLPPIGVIDLVHRAVRETTHDTDPA